MDFLKKVLIVCILLQFLLFIPSIALASDPVGPWENDSPLVHQIANHASVSLDSFLYVLAGSTSDDFPFVQGLDTSLTGIFRSWVSLADLPYPTYWHASATKSSKIYILGGTQFPPQTSINLVSYATKNFFGDLSNWSTLNHLPVRLSKGSSFISGDYIYFTGGWTDSEDVSSASNKVYYAHINSDGSLGSWNTTTDLPGVYWDHEIVEYQGHIYLVGGWKDGARSFEVYKADANPDGTLSSWSRTADLPDALENFGISRSNNLIIVVAGGSNSGLTNKVYYTEIQPDGTLSAWQTSAANLPVHHCCGAMSEAGGYLYLTGGYDGADYTNSVYKAQLLSVTPSPTPTPTPSATPTPSPTPPPTTKVILIPGTGASWNADALLNCKNSNYSGSWNMAPYAKHYYSDLILSINNSNYQVIPFYYDWRKQINSHNSEVGNLIASELNGNERIDLVGHSMGGLVGQSYLQSSGSNSRLEKLLTAGSPFNGVVQAYPGWSGGEIKNGDLIFRIGATILAKRCGATGPFSRAKLQESMPFIQNLLPTFNYLEDNSTQAIKPVTEMLAQNNWLPQDFSSSLFGVAVEALSGNGKSTPYAIRVKTPSKLDQLLGNWQDGDPIKYLTTDAGDGTVLTASSSLPGVTNVVINQSHVGLVQSKEGIQKILEFLGPVSNLSALSNLNDLSPEPDSALVIMSDIDEFSVVDEGSETKSQDRIVAFVNAPKKNLRLINLQNSGNIIVAQFLPNGKNLWKEYPVNGHYKKSAKINFDIQKEQEDILQWE